MDCNTCDITPTVVINKPEVIKVTLTISDKAKDMLSSAFGDDTDFLLVFCLVVVLATCMTCKSSNLPTKIVKNSILMGSEF